MWRMRWGDPVRRTGGDDPAEIVADEDDVIKVFPFENIDQVLHEDVERNVLRNQVRTLAQAVWVGVYTR